MDIKVGQKWKTRDGGTAEIIEHIVGAQYPFICVSGAARFSVTVAGKQSAIADYDSLDLVELIEPKPWYPDDSGEWIEVPDDQMYEPVLPVGTKVEVLLRRERAEKVVPDFPDFASNWCWKNSADKNGRIVAYKVVGEATPTHEEPDRRTETSALAVQVGGTHYKDFAIQPVEYIHANKLGFCEGNVVKYITRHAAKNGADDIRKVIHYCQLLLELQYGVKKEGAQ